MESYRGFRRAQKLWGILIPFFLFFATSRLNATIIVAIWTPDAMYVGADSRMVSLDRKRFGSVCKIQVDRKVVFAYAGFFRFSEILDVPALIRETSAWDNGKNDLDRMEAHFTGRLILPLAEARERIRKMPEIERSMIPETGELVTLLAQNGTGRIRYCGTSIAKNEPYFDSETGEIRIVTSDGVNIDLPSGRRVPMEILFAGQAGEAKEYLAAHADLTNDDPVMVIRTLIGVASRHHPVTVNGPIAILKVPNDGTMEWIERGACQQPDKRQ